METLYWLSVLGSVHEFGIMFMVFSIISLASFLIGMAVNSEKDDESRTNAFKFCKKCTIFSTVVFSASILIASFVPTYNELLTIYGVGSTIDYLKENPTAKQLPDKYIKVLDKWADEAIKESELKEKND